MKVVLDTENMVVVFETEGEILVTGSHNLIQSELLRVVLLKIVDLLLVEVLEQTELEQSELRTRIVMMVGIATFCVCFELEQRL